MDVPTTGRRLLRLGISVALAGTFGCTPARHPVTGAASTSSTPPLTAPSSTSAAQQEPTAEAPSDPAQADPWFRCSVPLPAGWKAAQSAGTIPHAAGEVLFVQAVSPDGKSAFVLDSVGGPPRLVWVRDHGKTRQTVYKPPSGSQAQPQLADFDGRWLVFSVSLSQDYLGPWDLYAWDTASGGAPRKIAHDGGSPNAPFLEPAVHDGEATWVQATASGSRQVHLYDLGSGHDRIVKQGDVQPSIFVGDLLVWPERASGSQPPHLAAASARDGSAATLPKAVAALVDPREITGDGRTWAWIDPGGLTLDAWRSGWDAPVVVRKAPSGDNIDWPRVAGDLITWTDSNATFAGDLRSHSYTQITAQYGATVTKGDALGVGYPEEGTGKGSDKSDINYIVAPSKLPQLPACR